jgi:tetratricopeptide (TPR) repeat protein
VRAFAACVAALAFVAARASAQDPRSEAAKAQYLKGQSAYDLGKYREALQRFEAAYELKPVPALLFNIAQCHRKLGHLEQAANLYRSFLRADPRSAQAEQAQSLLVQVEAAAARRSTSPDPPASLQPLTPIDGSDAASESLRRAYPIARQGELAGSSIEATAFIGGAATAEARNAPPSAVAQQAPPLAPERKRWPAAIAGGAAVALLAGGVVEALASRSATSQLEQLHQQASVDPARDQQLRDDANAKASRSKLLYVASGVAAAASIALWFAF